MGKIKKAIIPAAGLGTRFLPTTKAMPKEMLPIIDKPTIQYIVEEAVESGIEDIIIVTGNGKRMIEDHFDHVPDLERHLAEKGKLDLLAKVDHASTFADMHFIRQKQPNGLGHAIWCARNFIGNEPFAVLLPDTIVDHDIPCLKQLIEQYEETGASVIGVQQVADHKTHRSGIVQPASREGKLYQIAACLEKPASRAASSDLALMGRYIFTPELFQFLNVDGDFQLAKAIDQLKRVKDVRAYEYEGKSYDVGDALGFVKTTLAFALNSSEFGSQVEEMMIHLLDEKLETYA
ncbi:UTP--glucose-1-phosphate uridylyltransferase [Radiobacillus sp. PE A8.2]|uniref:UTP--glucose-1-phosphate uridylyltransferase n=1 Tax=Radiobacillus sp. PE A8.2 TaxID=3380349 RepID=UPI00388E8C52